jgi:hypothetical protein
MILKTQWTVDMVEGLRGSLVSWRGVPAVLCWDRSDPDEREWRYWLMDCADGMLIDLGRGAATAAAWLNAREVALYHRLERVSVAGPAA